ncbi:phosphoribosyltransferase, partial [Candidatus Woesearchaeota archaeon]|nr:phosphoribosyltransferase [Candidatus Woesearchaeota archaeon]
SLEALYYKKRDRSGISYLDRTLDGIMRGMLKAVPIELSQISTKKHTWEDLETMMQTTGQEISQSHFDPDLIIGIKSGGALIAKYVAQCLGGIEFTYMKVSHYSDASRSTLKSLKQVKKEARVTEESQVQVAGRTILLVDDQTATGASLIAGKQHLLQQGAREVKTFCLFAKETELVDFYSKKGLAVYFPWGKDA